MTNVYVSFTPHYSPFNSLHISIVIVLFSVYNTGHILEEDDDPSEIFGVVPAAVVSHHQHLHTHRLNVQLHHNQTPDQMMHHLEGLLDRLNLIVLSSTFPDRRGTSSSYCGELSEFSWFQSVESCNSPD